MMVQYILIGIMAAAWVKYSASKKNGEEKKIYRIIYLGAAVVLIIWFIANVISILTTGEKIG